MTARALGIVALVVVVAAACSASGEEQAKQAGTGAERPPAPAETLTQAPPDESRETESVPAVGAEQGACGEPGSWAHSSDAAWLRRAADLAGLEVVGCSARALMVEGTTSFSLWTSRGAPENHSEMPVFARLAGATVYGGDTRLAWGVQGVTVWLAPGPRTAEAPPAREELVELVFVTERLPRRPQAIELAAMPYGPLSRCRRDPLVRPACPTRIPRIPGWNTYGSRAGSGVGVFGIERGGEVPGVPELNRPPGLLHIEVWAGRPGSLGAGGAAAWPSAGAVRPSDGLLRLERTEPISLGRVRWGGRSGMLALMPGYPAGGSLGNHLVFRWREGGVEYFLSLHAWEPFRETVATLRAVAESIPR